MRRGCRLLLIDTTGKEEGERVGRCDKKREEEMDGSSCLDITTRPTTVDILRLSTVCREGTTVSNNESSNLDEHGPHPISTATLSLGLGKDRLLYATTHMEMHTKKTSQSLVKIN